MEISITNLIGPLLLVGLRVSGLMLFAPFFSSAVIPARMKIMLVITVTAVLYPVYSAHLPSFSVSQWPVIVAGELLVGIAIGLATNAVIEGAQLAGQILSIQMGYSLVNILDPNTQVENTVVALSTKAWPCSSFWGWVCTIGFCAPLRTVLTICPRAQPR